MRFQLPIIFILTTGACAGPMIEIGPPDIVSEIGAVKLDSRSYINNEFAKEARSLKAQINISAEKCYELPIPDCSVVYANADTIWRLVRRTELVLTSSLPAEDKHQALATFNEAIAKLQPLASQ
jgi:hypothetical protein